MRRMQIVLLTLSLLLLLSWGAAADMIESKHARMDTDLFYDYDGKFNEYSRPEELLADVDMYVELLTEVLNVECKDQITVVITNDLQKELSQRNDVRKMLYIMAEDFQYGMVPLCHEITHLLTPSIYGILYEGLAEYMSAQYEKNFVVASLYYEPSHLKAYRECLFLAEDELNQVLANTKWIEDFAEHKQTSYRRIGYSLVEYLIEEYGLESFMQLYLSKNPAGYEAAFSKNRDEITLDWKEYMNTQVALEEEAHKARILNKFKQKS